MREPHRYIPKGLLLQWHITERCNLRCKHCYHKGYDGADLPFTTLLGFLDQYKSLLREWRKTKKVWGHINVTGGEPFMRGDFMELLDVFSDNRDTFSYAILTNGTFIDREAAKHLRTLKPKYVQISIEGGKKAHDSVRGQGNYDLSVAALKNLAAEKVPTCVSFTAHKDNFREFAHVAETARMAGVSRVWADRLIPYGEGKKLGLMDPSETCEFFNLMGRARSRRRIFNKTEVSMHRSLQFLVGGGKPYRCNAGDGLLTLQSNGDVYPCRRMPIKVGNLLEERLSDIYYKNDLLCELRDRDSIDPECKKCFYSKLCGGGLRCLSYALTGNPFQKDPGCFHKVDI